MTDPTDTAGRPRQEFCGSEHPEFGACNRPPHTDGCHERKGPGGKWAGWATDSQAEEMRSVAAEAIFANFAVVTGESVAGTPHKIASVVIDALSEQPQGDERKALQDLVDAVVLNVGKEEMASELDKARAALATPVRNASASTPIGGRDIDQERNDAAANRAGLADDQRSPGTTTGVVRRRDATETGRERSPSPQASGQCAGEGARTDLAAPSNPEPERLAAIEAVDSIRELIVKFAKVGDRTAGEWLDRHLRTIRSVLDRPAAPSNPGEPTGGRQQAIDTAIRVVRESQYVGGPSQEDAWRTAYAAIAPFESEGGKGHNPRQAQGDTDG